MKVGKINFLLLSYEWSYPSLAKCSRLLRIGHGRTGIAVDTVDAV